MTLVEALEWAKAHKVTLTAVCNVGVARPVWTVTYSCPDRTAADYTIENADHPLPNVMGEIEALEMLRSRVEGLDEEADQRRTEDFYREPSSHYGPDIRMRNW